MTAEPAIPEPSPLDAALDYAARGWRVFPCHPGSKIAAAGKGGYHNATSDPATIRQWWAERPDANIGLALDASGLVAIDADSYKPECQWEAFKRGVAVPETLTQRSAAGGTHLIFAAAEGDAFPGQLAPGVDIKHRGYILLAPSRVDGRAYRFVNEAPVAPVPDWLPRKGAQGDGEAPRPPEPSDNVELLPIAWLTRELERMRAAEAGENAWAEKALNEEVARVLAAPAGQRNATLNRAAFSLGQIVGGGGLDRDRAEAALARAARSIGLGEDEIAATIRSGMESGAAEPRTAPERPSGPGIARAPLRAPDGPLFAPASALAGQPVPSRKWHVRDLIPAETVTMLGGDGGTGKSLLALQLATSTALDRPWIHRAIEAPGRALFLTAEDDLPEVHRRLADICRADGLDLARLGNLFLRSLAGEDALLAVLDRASGILVPTPLYGAVDGAMGELRPSLLVLDTLADLHSGEENNRAHARQFIGFLRGLAIRHGAAVLLLAHPSLTGMSSGSGLSGSTAWNGSVRSRLYLDRVLDDGYEPNPDARRLTTKKANYARTGEEIALTWRDGVFVADAPPTGLDRVAASAKAERVFLALLRLFTDQGRYVSASPSNSYAPKVFAEHPSAEGCTKRALKGAMESLLASGRLAIAEHGTGAKARKHLVCNEGCNP